jgi:hypothetical protein
MAILEMNPQQFALDEPYAVENRLSDFGHREITIAEDAVGEINVRKGGG